MANKNIMPPTKERKADTTKNSNNLSEFIERQKEYEKTIIPLADNLDNGHLRHERQTDK